MLPSLLTFRLLHRAATALALLALAVVIASGVACQGGDKARDFEVQTFEGKRFRLSEQYEGNVVVINFWYPSCPPCREEMPEFQMAWQELDGEPVRFLGMFVPTAFDTEQTAREFVSEFGLTFNFATDRQKAVATAYGIEFYPTTWFIDRGGGVAEIHSGALNAEQITGKVKGLLE